MTRRKARILLLLTATLPWVIMLSTNIALGTPTGEWLPDQCSRACHNRGCSHDPVLSDALTGDDGMFGLAVHGLYGMGSLSGLSSFEGYGAANLAVFCALWPAGMLTLIGVGLRQRTRLSELRRAS